MSKRAEVREKRRRKKQRERLTVGLIIVGVTLIILAIIALPYLQPIGEVVTPPPVARELINGNAIGDPNAPVILEEYSDFQCGHCRNFSENIEPLLVEEYVRTGKLYIVYNPLPLYASSIPISEASLCAREQDKFWEYKDIIYANQSSSSSNPFSDRRLSAFAEAIDLDIDLFNKCLGDRKYKNEIEQLMIAADNLEIQGTPTFYINGKLIYGAMPIENFRAEIEAALAIAEGS
jgi:protein-disulfide isomerase